MKKEEIIKGNIIIAEFLDWEKRYIEDEDTIVYRIPNNFEEDTGWQEMEVSSFYFDSDWNWLMHCWDMLHRKVLVPTSKHNPHLRREIREMINDMRSTLKWSHIEGAYKTLIKIITWYNNLFE